MGKKAVLIGCNYPGTKAELKGCINDVHRMHRCLIDRFGFDDNNINVLIDTDPSYTQPTGKNIRGALHRLIDSAKPGDFLFVHYSGHGTRLPAETGEPDDTGYDECIVPTDMNLITDDDFKELVCSVPRGCRLTIVSDSCHSGGLIDDAKEQIGESTKNNNQRERENTHGFTAFLKQTMKNTMRDAIESRGIHVPMELHRHLQHPSDDYKVVEDGFEDQHGHLKSKSMSLSTLVDLLRERTGRNDIDVGKLRPTLFDVFGEDASPKVKKFMKVILDKLQKRRTREGNGEDRSLLSLIGSLAEDFMRQKLNENETYAEPAIQTKLESKKEAYAGGAERKLPVNGILLSGCQTDQTSADASPKGKAKEAYGAFSNAVQTILAESDGRVTNRTLVTKARRLLKSHGFKQRPGLYSNDEHADALFIC